MSVSPQLCHSSDRVPIGQAERIGADGNRWLLAALKDSAGEIGGPSNTDTATFAKSWCARRRPGLTARQLRKRPRALTGSTS
jgi:hypothetical protein